MSSAITDLERRDLAQRGPSLSIPTRLSTSADAVIEETGAKVRT